MGQLANSPVSQATMRQSYLTVGADLHPAVFPKSDAEVRQYLTDQRSSDAEQQLQIMVFMRTLFLNTAKKLATDELKLREDAETALQWSNWLDDRRQGFYKEVVENARQVRANVTYACSSRSDEYDRNS